MCNAGEYFMNKEPLAIPQYYSRKLKDNRTESEMLLIFAKKIKRVPATIRIPSEYLTDLGKRT